MKLKKIIHVTSYYPPHLGGQENYVKIISNKLAKKGYDIDVFTSDMGAKNKKPVLSHNHRVFYLNSVEFAHTAIIFSLFKKLLIGSKPSLIHLHVAQAFSPEIIYLVSKLRNIPYIAHIHSDVEPTGIYGIFLEPYKRIFLRHVLRNANKIICLSDSQKKIIAQKYGISHHKIVAIRNGVDDAYFSKRIINKKDIPTILFVGRLGILKNIPRLIKAVSLMKVPAQLRIVGDGEDRTAIENLISDLKLSNITLVGKKFGSELIEEYKKADVLVLPSDREGGAPLVVLEALATGLPVVISEIYGIRELLGESVLLVKNPTSENFSIALDKLLSDIDMQKTLSSKGEEIIKNFRWENIILDLEYIYKEVSS
jgi:glycosyltransferase involved in cell wall biosynthesis